MNKSEIIKNLTHKMESLNDEDVQKCVHLIIDSLTNALTNSDRVEIRNFGTFSVRKRERRISRNPKTGTSVLVEAKNHPYFRSSKHLKESLNT